MIIEVIPPKNWSSFLNYFSRLHKELTCSIIVMDGPAEISAGKDLRFSVISFTDKTEKDINIISMNRGREINHLVKAIKQICVTRSNDGVNASILIESADNFITSLKFGEN